MSKIKTPSAAEAANLDIFGITAEPAEVKAEQPDELPVKMVGRPKKLGASRFTFMLDEESYKEAAFLLRYNENKTASAFVEECFKKYIAEHPAQASDYERLYKTANENRSRKK